MEAQVKEYNAILDNTRNAAKVIKAAGAAVEEIQCPPPFHGLTDVQAVILAVEAARELAFERMAHAGDLSQSLMDLFAFADSITADAYDDACRWIETIDISNHLV